MTMQGIAALAQTAPPKANDVTTPLHLMKPAYVTPYGETKQADVKAVLDRMYNYLETATPYQLVERGSLLTRDAKKLFGSLANLARRLCESIRNVLIPANATDPAQAANIQIRLNTS